MAIVPPGSGDTLNPITDAGWDGWFLHRWLFLAGSPIASNAGDSVNIPSSGVETQLASGAHDIKAMRKIPQGSHIMVSVAAEQTAMNVGSDGFRFNFNFRSLLMQR